MKLDRKLIRFIKKNFLYHEYIENQGLATTPAGNSCEIRICCPKCEESDFKCYVNDEKKTFCCFKCDFGHYGNGDVFDFVANIESIPVSAALQRLCADYRSVTPEDIQFEEEEDAEISPPSFETIKTIEDLPLGSYVISEDDPDAQPYIEYLKGRGLTMEDILATNAHYTSSLARHKKKDGKRVHIGNRVLWPIYGGKGDLVSWLTRAISEDPEKKHIKYINCPDTELSKTFWPFVPMAPGKTEAVICEGLIDALSLRRAGFAAFATFGKKMSEEQILLLKHWGVDSITLFYDQDAKKEVIKLVDSLKLRFQRVFVVDTSDWPRGQDSGSLLAREDGCQILEKTLSKRIIVTDELAFLKWRLQ